jgi:hypothetical protein
MSRTVRIRHLPRLRIARRFAWATNKFAPASWRDDAKDVPILSPHSHPWVRYAANVPANVPYRKAAHRAIRVREKRLLNRSGADFDEVLMPMWREYFDAWNFT